MPRLLLGAAVHEQEGAEEVATSGPVCLPRARPELSGEGLAGTLLAPRRARRGVRASFGDFLGGHRERGMDSASSTQIVLMSPDEGPPAGLPPRSRPPDDGRLDLELLLPTGGPRGGKLLVGPPDAGRGGIDDAPLVPLGPPRVQLESPSGRHEEPKDEEVVEYWAVAEPGEDGRTVVHQGRTVHHVHGGKRWLEHQEDHEGFLHHGRHRRRHEGHGLRRELEEEEARFEEERGGLRSSEPEHLLVAPGRPLPMPLPLQPLPLQPLPPQASPPLGAEPLPPLAPQLPSQPLQPLQPQPPQPLQPEPLEPQPLQPGQSPALPASPPQSLPQMIMEETKEQPLRASVIAGGAIAIFAQAYLWGHVFVTLFKPRQPLQQPGQPGASGADPASPPPGASAAEEHPAMRGASGTVAGALPPRGSSSAAAGSGAEDSGAGVGLRLPE